MIVCLCRLIDSDDFESDEVLKERILEDDYRCGQCQIQYLMQERSSSPPDTESET